MPATAICLIRRSWSTTTARISWPAAWVRMRTTTIQGSAVSWSRVAYLSDPHGEFRKADLDDRQELYGLLADYIWSPDRLDEVLTQDAPMYP